jgi:hypothetical protein
MIEMRYQFNVQEMVETTLVFLENRPFLKFMIFFMKLSCWLFLFVFVLKIALLSVSISDGMVGLFCVSWLLYRRQLNAFLLTQRLNKQKLNDASLTVQILKHKIWWQGSFMPQGEQRFKNMRLIYQTQQGFILPLVGISKSAQFIWLPHRCFQSEEAQKQFLLIIKTHPIIIKQLSSASLDAT